MKPKQPSRTTRAFEKALAARPVVKYVMRLYVAGATERSRRAIVRARQLCEAQLNGDFELEVIDVYQQPELARANQIVATPTLVKEFPNPVRRFVGNLINTTRLFDELEDLPKGSPAL